MRLHDMSLLEPTCLHVIVGVHQSKKYVFATFIARESRILGLTESVLMDCPLTQKFRSRVDLQIFVGLYPTGLLLRIEYKEAFIDMYSPRKWIPKEIGPGPIFKEDDMFWQVSRWKHHFSWKTSTLGIIGVVGTWGGSANFSILRNADQYINFRHTRLGQPELFLVV